MTDDIDKELTLIANQEQLSGHAAEFLDDSNLWGIRNEHQ